MLVELVKFCLMLKNNYLLLIILFFTVQLLPLTDCFSYRSFNYSYRSNNNIPYNFKKYVQLRIAVSALQCSEIFTQCFLKKLIAFP